VIPTIQESEPNTRQKEVSFTLQRGKQIQMQEDARFASYKRNVKVARFASLKAKCEGRNVHVSKGKM